MNCASCGGLNSNPGATQCTYCGKPLAAPGGYGAQPPGYGPPAQGFGAQPGGYGPPPAYGAPPNAYGAPPNPYGAPPNPYGGPAPGMYGGPQPGMHPVQPFGGGYSGGPVVRSGGFWNTTGSVIGTFNMIRIIIAVAVLSIVALGACVEAIANNM